MTTTTTQPAADQPPAPDATRVRYLLPDSCKIHLGTHNALHVTIVNERIYGGVYAAYAFPVRYPNGYVSLIHTTGERKKDVEIGIIRDLDEFPPEQAELVRQALARRYLVHTITKIKKIGWKYGFIALEVETDKGSRNFLMQWSTDRAVDYGQTGKVLIDVDENRYLIPDLEKFPPKERSEFVRYIYW